MALADAPAMDAKACQEIPRCQRRVKTLCFGLIRDRIGMAANSEWGMRLSAGADRPDDTDLTVFYSATWVLPWL